MFVLSCLALLLFVACLGRQQIDVDCWRWCDNDDDNDDDDGDKSRWNNDREKKMTWLHICCSRYYTHTKSHLLAASELPRNDHSLGINIPWKWPLTWNTTSQSLWMTWKLTELPGISQNFPNFPEFPEILTWFICLILPRTCQNLPELPTTAHNCPKLPRTTQNCSEFLQYWIFYLAECRALIPNHRRPHCPRT